MKRFYMVSLSALWVGCFFPADRGRVLEDRFDALMTDNTKLRADLEETQATLAGTVKQLKETLDQLDRASRTTGANIGVKVDTATQDLAGLRGQIEAYQHRLQELEQKLAAQPAGGTSGAEPKKEELKRPDDPREFLKLADEKAKAGEAELARRLYTEFVKKWAKDPAAGEAHYGLGETYFNDQKCREALYEYGKVIQDHPETRSAPDAYLRSAECFKELKMAAEAKLALQELLKIHPKSAAGKMAKAKLSESEKKPVKAVKK
jgi:tol-pal system protein YbgF